MIIKHLIGTRGRTVFFCSQKLYYWFFEDEPLIETSKRLANQTQENAIEFFEKIDRFKEKFME